MITPSSSLPVLLISPQSNIIGDPLITPDLHFPPPTPKLSLCFPHHSPVARAVTLRFHRVILPPASPVRFEVLPPAADALCRAFVRPSASPRQSVLTSASFLAFARAAAAAVYAEGGRVARAFFAQRGRRGQTQRTHWNDTAGQKVRSGAIRLALD